MKGVEEEKFARPDKISPFIGAHHEKTNHLYKTP
jgi:hypothetical protein